MLDFGDTKKKLKGARKKQRRGRQPQFSLIDGVRGAPKPSKPQNLA
jgi:hypothetical protein